MLLDFLCRDLSNIRFAASTLDNKAADLLKTILVFHSWRPWRWIVFSCLCFTLVFTVKTALNSCVPSILFLTYTRRQIRWHGSNMLLNTYLWLCCPPLVFAVGKLYKLSANYSISCCWLKREVQMFGPSVEQLKVMASYSCFIFCDCGWRGQRNSKSWTGFTTSRPRIVFWVKWINFKCLHLISKGRFWYYS